MSGQRKLISLEMPGQQLLVFQLETKDILEPEVNGLPSFKGFLGMGSGN